MSLRRAVHAGLAGLTMIIVLDVGTAASAQPKAQPPEPPRVLVAMPPPTTGGKVVTVPAGGDLQAVLDAAQPGDTIQLEAGSTYTGPFTLRYKPGSSWITIQSNHLGAGFPREGTRVDPDLADAMPKLVTRSGSVLVAASRAHHYRFIGLEIRPASGSFLYNLVQLGLAERSAGDVPHHVVFERCYLHGDLKAGTRRGIAMNGAHIAVVDSYLADFKEVGSDSQTIAGWNGPGPFKIVNNYLEAAGENVMFGGSPPAIPDLVPSDIEVRANHLAKPLTWKHERWSVKNLFELKNARRVLLEGNVLEHSWVSGQTGFAILLTVRAEGGRAPWAAVDDVSIVNNVVHDTAGGVNILALDDSGPSAGAHRILIRNNLFDHVTTRLFQLLRGASDLVIEHNTAFGNYVVVFAEGEPHHRFVFRDNLVPFGAYGILGTGAGSGSGTLQKYFPDSTVAGNVFFGGNAQTYWRLYPAGNSFVALPDVGFVNPDAGDWRLRADSQFRKRPSDGKDVGVDFDTLLAALRANASLLRR